MIESDYVIPYYSPIKIDLFFSKKQIGGTQRYASDIIKDIPNISENIVSDTIIPNETSTIIINFDGNDKSEEGYNFFAKGRNSAVYKGVFVKTVKHNKYQNKNIVLKILDENLDSTIEKYNELLKDTEIKKCLPDILFYGDIYIFDKKYNYMIMPVYLTDYINQTFKVKINIIISLLHFLIHLNNINLVINDLKVDNIGFIHDGNIILIDFDRTTINDIFSYQLIIPNYVNDNLIKYRKQKYTNTLNKLYSVVITEFIYLIIFKNQPNFIETYLQKNKTDFMYTPIDEKKIRENLISLFSNPDNFLYNRFEKILLDKISGKGLLAKNYEYIYTYEEVIDEIQKIKEKIESTKISQEQLLIGGYYNKYLKYKNKYIVLSKLNKN